MIRSSILGASNFLSVLIQHLLLQSLFWSKNFGELVEPQIPVAREGKLGKVGKIVIDKDIKTTITRIQGERVKENGTKMRGRQCRGTLLTK